MNWAIQSVGDVAYLEAVLQGLSMILGAGTFAAVGKIGFLVGVLILLFQALPGGGSIRPGQIIAAWVVFVGMFGWTADVVVEDVYSGDTRVVNDIPGGIAASGSFISQIGYGMTETFETAFSAPAMTDQGWGSYLHTLTAVRKSFTAESQLGQANHPRGSDSNVYQSWVSYMDRCTLYDVEREFRSYGEIANTDDVIEAMASIDPNATFSFYDGGTAAGTELTCLNGFAVLSAMTYDEFLPIFVETRIAPQLGIDPPSQSEALYRVQVALDALGLWVAAEDFIVSSFIQNCFTVSAKVHALETGNGAQATMINDAMQQRAISWISESRIFDEYMRPMQSAIEGFGYAIAPMLALIVTLGPFGMSATARFFQLLIWIQLWMPALAVINLFTYLGVSGRLSAIQDTQGLAITSLNGMDQFDAVVQPWLGTAGMMAASVPALTLMVVYGGAVTASGLAQRLRGTDVVDEKRSAPNVTDATPVGSYSSGSLSGRNITPTSEGHAINVPEASAFKINAATAGQQLLTSAQSARDSAAVQHSERLSHALQANANSSNLAKAGEQISESSQSTQSQVNGTLSEVASTAAERYAASQGITNGAQIRDIKRAMAQAGVEAGFNLGIVKGGGGVNGSIERDGSASVDLNAAQTKALDSSISEKFGSTEGFRAEMAKGDAYDRSHGIENVFTTSFGTGNQEELARSASRVQSAEESVQRAGSLSNQLGVSQTFSGERLAQLGNNREAMDYLRGAIDREGLRGRVESDLQQNENRYHFGGSSGNEAYSMLKHLSEPGDNAASTERRLSAIASSLSLFNGTASSPEMNAARNEGMLAAGPSLGQSLQNRVEGAVDPNLGERVVGPTAIDGPEFAENTRENVAGGQSLVDGNFAEGRSLAAADDGIEMHREASQDAVTQRSDENRRGVRSEGGGAGLLVSDKDEFSGRWSDSISGPEHGTSMSPRDTPQQSRPGRNRDR